MERNRENHRPSGTRLKALQLLTILGIAGGPSVLAGIEHDKDISARAEAQTTVQECRDKVRCMLGKISMAYEAKFPGLHNIDTTPTGQTIELGGQSFQVMTSSIGYVLVDSDGNKYLATKNLANTIENVKAFIGASENTVASNQ